MTPLVGLSRPTITRPIVVLPQPDSPTSPKVSPGRTPKLTSATALSQPTRRCSTAPLVTGKFLTRCSMLSSDPVPVTGAAAGGAAAAGSTAVTVAPFFSVSPTG